MKITIQKEIFTDETLRFVITAGQVEKDDVPEAEFAVNLLAVQDLKERDERIAQYVSCLLEQNSDGKKHAKTCRRLIDKLQTAIADSSEPLTEKVATRVDEVFYTFWPELKNREPIAKDLLGKFPEYAGFRELVQNKDKLIAMRASLERHCRQDQKIQELKKSRHQEEKKEGFNRFKNGEVQLEDGQKMIVVGIPRRNLQEVRQYWQMIAQTEAPLMITLNSKGQWDHALAFWSKKVIEQAGVTVERTSRTVLFESNKLVQDKIDHEQKEVKLQVVKREFIVKDDQGKTHVAHHLHVKHWPDHEPCPDLAALDALFRERDALVKDKNKPIVINCQGGVGRTGELALIEACKNALAMGKTELNIPEIMYQMRRFQPQLFGSHPEQIQQACQFIRNNFMV